jgi:hypothetical protein
MQPMDILVLGPEGPGLTQLEDTISRLGHEVVRAEQGWQASPPTRGDVMVLDLRDDDHDWRRMADLLRDDVRPLVIVADQPRRLMWALTGRPAGMMVLTGAESDGSYRVALRVCQALRASRDERSRRKRSTFASGLATL